MKPLTFVIDLQGRFGNQLFQISAAKMLENLGADVYFDAPKNSIDSDILRINFLRSYVVDRLVFKQQFSFQALNSLRRRGRRIFLSPRSVLVESESLKSNLQEIDSSRWLIGYFQSLEHTGILIKELRDYFDLNVIEPEFITRIHIRKGDFVRLNLDLSLDWYVAALDLLMSKNNVQSIQVITDDVEWYYQNVFRKTEWPIEKSRDVLQNFESLALSSNLVLSRSSFSWWAAAISNAKVIAPSPWFDGLTLKDDLILPTNWNKLLTETFD
jgi:hypothetical protein